MATWHVERKKKVIQNSYDNYASLPEYFKYFSLIKSINSYLSTSVSCVKTLLSRLSSQSKLIRTKMQVYNVHNCVMPILKSIQSTSITTRNDNSHIKILSKSYPLIHKTKQKYESFTATKCLVQSAT